MITRIIYLQFLRARRSGHHAPSLINRTYTVPHANAFLPAAAWYLPFYLCFVFALAERKNETQRKMKYRCERSNLGYCVSPVINRTYAVGVFCQRQSGTRFLL